MNDFIFVIIELFSLALTVEALQGKTCQDLLLLGEGRSLGAKISGGRGRPSGIFFVLYKTRHILLLSDSKMCLVLYKTKKYSRDIPISVAAKWLNGSRCHLVWS